MDAAPRLPCARRAVGSARRSAAVAVAGIALSLGAVASAAPEAPPPDDTALVELGRRLFFDRAASRTGMRACVDCHRPEHGFSDPLPKSLDDTKTTTRHAQTLVDGAANLSGHWDGEFRRIEDLVLSRLEITFDTDGTTRYGSADGRGRFLAGARGGGRSGGSGLRPATSTRRAGDPIVGFVDPGRAADLPAVESNLAVARRYPEAFRATFGDDDVTKDRIASALAAYCHSIESGRSAYDRHVAGETDALSASARRGLDLFRGAAGCATCHSMARERATFTDYAFHDTGIAWKAVPEAQRKARVAGAQAEDPLRGVGDPGASARTSLPQHVRAFKTPTLRDVASRGPYMHDGSLATLADVVRHYAAGPVDDPNLDRAFPEFSASEQDVADLVAFLRSLTSERRPGLATIAWETRAERTLLRFVDADGRALAGWRIGLEPAGDVLPGFEPRHGETAWATTGADGSVAFAAAPVTHTKIVLPDGLLPSAGDLVPDTCREATVVVPVRGRATLLVSSRRTDLPDVLVAMHPRSAFFPDRKEPESRFRRVVGPSTQEGVAYEAPLRVDAGEVVDLRLPEPAWGLDRMRLFLEPDSPTLVVLP